MMEKNIINPKVNAYISKAKKWQDETEHLRQILLECGLTEELKWGKPCYCFEGKNVVVIQGFKEYFALLFFKGMLLKDPDKILIKTGENTRVGRQIRFTNVKEIVKQKAILKTYINEAVKLEKAGLKVPAKDKTALVLPAEFKSKLDKNTALKTAFNSLTPGRQKGYSFYFTQAKQAQTREARIEKCVPKILKGEGLNDRV